MIKGVVTIIYWAIEMENKLRYRLITGKDDATFCERISKFLDEGYKLYGSPSCTFDWESVIVVHVIINDEGFRKGGRSMPIEYKNVVPWGRKFDEYCQMFDLTERDLKKAIISCGDGPASFNFEATKKGYSVTSIDPIYFFTKEQIQKRINETYEIVLEKTSINKEYFVWKSI